MAKYLTVDDLVSTDKKGNVTLWWSRGSKTKLGGGVIIPTHQEIKSPEMVEMLRDALRLAVELDREERARAK